MNDYRYEKCVIDNILRIIQHLCTSPSEYTMCGPALLQIVQFPFKIDKEK